MAPWPIYIIEAIAKKNGGEGLGFCLFVPIANSGGLNNKKNAGRATTWPKI